MRERIEQAGPWLLRVAWGLLPVTLGPTLADRLHDWESAIRFAASAMLWIGWAVVAVASCVALPACLAVVGVGVCAAVAVGGAAQALGALVAVGAAAAAAQSATVEWFLNGPAYANERRYPLGIPGPIVVLPLWLAVVATVLGPAAAVMLFAGGEYVAGAVVAVVGGGAAAVGGRALYGLTRRWVVFVPAGMVLHDPMTLTDPVLFERKLIESLHAAPAGSDSLDLTGAALGLALELVLTEKVPMVLSKGRRNAESGASARLLFTPMRPGRVLARGRGTPDLGRLDLADLVVGAHIAAGDDLDVAVGLAPRSPQDREEDRRLLRPGNAVGVVDEEERHAGDAEALRHALVDAHLLGVGIAVEHLGHIVDVEAGLHREALQRVARADRLALEERAFEEAFLDRVLDAARRSQMDEAVGVERVAWADRLELEVDSGVGAGGDDAADRRPRRADLEAVLSRDALGVGPLAHLGARGSSS